MLAEVLGHQQTLFAREGLVGGLQGITDAGSKKQLLVGVWQDLGDITVTYDNIAILSFRVRSYSLWHLAQSLCQSPKSRLYSPDLLDQ